MSYPTRSTTSRATFWNSPQKGRVRRSITSDGFILNSQRVEYLDSLSAVEFERQRQLQDIADHNDEDAAEIARRDSLLEGNSLSLMI